MLYEVITSPSHLLGFFSSVVPEIVKEVDFYKGSFPVKYGGKLSSVIDIETKDPLLDTFNVNAELRITSYNVCYTKLLRLFNNGYSDNI